MSQHRSGFRHAAALRWSGSSATKATHQLVAPRGAGGERAGGLKLTTVARAHLRCFDAALMLCTRMASSLKRDGSWYLPPRVRQLEGVVHRQAQLCDEGETRAGRAESRAGGGLRALLQLCAADSPFAACGR
ncbi:hypothetical protein AB1Y20_011824 [Prymnesium parvum]|uniref:Uncharacterized protein n=1 Tax=Prymnesium parvum TaxID=97485 RepID=A0AB34IK78_PRYPA